MQSVKGTTVETLIAISDPSADSKSRLVSLIHPVGEAIMPQSTSQVVEVSGEVNAAVMQMQDVIEGTPEYSEQVIYQEISEPADSHSQPSMDTPDYSQQVVLQEIADHSDAQTQEATRKFAEMLYEQGAADTLISISGSADQQMLVATMPHSNFQSLLAASEVHASTALADADLCVTSSDEHYMQEPSLVLASGDINDDTSYVDVAQTIEIPVTVNSGGIQVDTSESLA